MVRESYTARDGKTICLAVWEADSPKAVVQISHGMSEHIERYDDFALYLNGKGLTVIGDDHRAHGKTDLDRLGMAEPGKDLFEDTVEDMAEITDYAKEKYGVPVFLLGHSYGSFLSQEYLLKYSDKILGCVLSGSALYSGFISWFGKTVAGSKSKKHPDDPGEFFAGITFKTYDKKVGEGLNGWLSRNAESNTRYNEDPLCGFYCSNGFYKYFFTHLNVLSKNSFASVRKDLPLMIAYGSGDYVGERGKLLKPLISKYKKAGLNPVEKRYEGMRHEILNETEKSVVYDDVAAFFLSLL